MQIDVEYTQSFERAYIASRARRPLIELARGDSEPPITVETKCRAALIRSAMEKTIMDDVVHDCASSGTSRDLLRIRNSIATNRPFVRYPIGTSIGGAWRRWTKPRASGYMLGA